MNNITNRQTKQTIHSEELAYWFLRLNGFLTTINFVVHPDRGREQRTDVDILGCRFPYRRELFDDPMVDFELFTRIRDKVLVVIAEVKRGTCRLNGPWTQSERENMQRVLLAVGAFHENEVDSIAHYLYRDGCFESQNVRITLLCIGSQENREIRQTHPEVPQITWNEILAFIYFRFRSYRQQKSAHPQWDNCGKLLWKVTMQSPDGKAFINRFEIS